MKGLPTLERRRSTDQKQLAAPATRLPALDSLPAGRVAAADSSGLSTRLLGSPDEMDTDVVSDLLALSTTVSLPLRSEPHFTDAGDAKDKTASTNASPASVQGRVPLQSRRIDDLTREDAPPPDPSLQVLRGTGVRTSPFPRVTLSRTDAPHACLPILAASFDLQFRSRL